MSVTLTQQAATHIGRYLQKRGKGIGLRLGVRTTGCSGMAYKLAKPGVFYGQESGHAHPIVTEADFDFEGFTDEELEEAGLLFAGIPA